MSNATSQDLIDVLGPPLNFLLLGVIHHMCFHAFCLSMATIISKLVYKTETGNLFLNWIVCAFNVSAIVNAIFAFTLTAVPLTTQKSCFIVNFLQNITYHLTLIIFDYLILFKSYSAFAIIAGLASINRLTWTIADLFWSEGSFEDETCSLLQNALSGTQYAVADIIIDAVGTLGAMHAFFAANAHLLPLDGIFYHVMKENVFRTVLVLAVNCVLIFINSMSSRMNENINYIASLCGGIIIYFLMNLELYWKESRNREASSPSLSGKHSNFVNNVSNSNARVKSNLLTEVQDKSTT